MTIRLATPPRCGWCGTQIDDDDDSLDFCGELHQQLWNHAHHGRWPTPAQLAEFSRQLGEVIRPAIEQLGRAFAAATEALRPLITTARPTAPDPMAQALERRRNRNTGPRDTRRAPARIDPTRTRR
jgi:hypothetical protein